jgi:predicted RNA-binding protein
MFDANAELIGKVSRIDRLEEKVDKLEKEVGNLIRITGEQIKLNDLLRESLGEIAKGMVAEVCKHGIGL